MFKGQFVKKCGRCAMAAAAVSAMSVNAQEVKGSVQFEPVMDKAAVLAAKETKVQSVVVTGTVGGDLVFKPKMTKAAVLSGGSATVQSLEIRK